jgi:alcohol dehydrogenase class IV
VHGIEAYVSNASSPLTDLHALEGIRLISENLLACINNLEDIELQTNIMRGSLETGLAFSNASLGGVHAMAHSLGGFKDLPHGECNSMLLRHVMDFNYSSTPEKFQKVGEAMGLDLRGLTTKEMRARVLGKIDSLRKDIGITATLNTHGVSTSDISTLSAHAIDDVCLVTNPRRVGQRDIEVLYEEAM